MLLIDTYAGPSHIEGVGVFAAQPVRKGARVWTLDLGIDRLISAEELERASPVFQKFVERYAYFDAGLGGYLLDGDHSRFLNHSDDALIEFRSDGDGYARRAIRRGQELTCNYSEFMPQLVILPSRVGDFQAKRL
ncbi:SET domain-containing protein [Hyphobacterium sp. HN65]|uniref:SET domain-containing protein n=1 Tax=Hyphobacterium lacteum TaxID=3116575 RepID=A0ABU7LMS7_9PROT|nr:SET domain-containing protein [Hyphobacterium sp. HN65]MEE2525228.1 SET domain-containing protein [Hyphobacterium sp. HN65]